MNYSDIINEFDKYINEKSDRKEKANNFDFAVVVAKGIIASLNVGKMISIEKVDLVFLAFMAYKNEEISLGKVAELLDVDRETVRKLYNKFIEEVS